MNKTIDLLIRELNKEKETHARCKTTGTLKDIGSTIGVVMALAVKDNIGKAGFTKAEFLMAVEKGFELVESTET